MFLLMCTALLPEQSIHAAQLHAIIVGDSPVGKDQIESSINYMQRAVKRIAAATDLSLNAQTFEEYQVQIENILDYISRLPVQTNDVIICYFNAPGSRLKDKGNVWPDLGFKLDTCLYKDKGYIDFESIYEMLKLKNPRLLLCLADSCNAIRDENSATDENEEDMKERALFTNRGGFPLPFPASQYIVLTSQERKLIRASFEENTINNYSHLFLEQKGSIIASSSSKGEKSVKWPVIGGVYTIEFLRALNTATADWDSLSKENTDKPTWSAVLDLVQNETLKTLEESESIPQYEIQ